MPTLIEREKATQRKALAKQRVRARRFKNQRKALARTRAAIRKARSKIGKRRKLIKRLEAELAGGPVRIEGNGGPGKIHGGTPRERLVACAKAAALAHYQGRRKSFYSQSGTWTVKHGILGEPRGYRSDCSQFWLSMYWSADLPDPTGANYGSGYTGTIGNKGLPTASPGKGGDAGLYGSFPHHHVEMSIGGGHFVGHGSPPVDGVTPGWPDLFRTYIHTYE
jgi:hypothetical protein